MQKRLLNLIFATLLMLFMSFETVAFDNWIKFLAICNMQEENTALLKSKLSEYQEGPCFYIKSDRSICATKTKEFFDYGESAFRNSSFIEFKQMVKKTSSTKKQLILILVEDETKFKDLKQYLNYLVDLDMLGRCLIVPCCDENQFK